MYNWNDFRNSLKDYIDDMFYDDPDSFNNDGYSLFDACSESDIWYLAYCDDLAWFDDAGIESWFKDMFATGGYDALVRFDGYYSIGEDPFNGVNQWQTAYYLLYQAALCELLPYCERVANYAESC